MRLDKEESSREYLLLKFEVQKKIRFTGEDVLIKKSTESESIRLCEYDLSCEDACHIKLTQGQVVIGTWKMSGSDMPEINQCPCSDKLNNAQDVFIAGRHLDQYRIGMGGKDYYEEAVERNRIMFRLCSFVESLLIMHNTTSFVLFTQNEKSINRFDKNPFTELAVT